jgi:lysophospholipase L1-like esterase
MRRRFGPRIWTWLAPSLAMLVAVLWLAAQAVAAARFEAQIAAFEAADVLHPPAHGGIVFSGSSTIRLWPRLAEDFPGLPIIQRGFGGATVLDLLHYADRIIVPYRPRLIVLLVGANDLARGRTPEATLALFRALTDKLRHDLPEVRVCILAINPSLARWRLQPQVERTNHLLADLAAERPSWMTFVDSASSLREPDGTPRRQLLALDRLHLNPAGYVVLAQAVRPQVERLWSSIQSGR